jgi:hypothetical protein
VRLRIILAKRRPLPGSRILGRDFAMVKLTRRLLPGLAAALLPGVGRTQGWPDHAVRLIVPTAPAGPTDVMARVIAPGLGGVLGLLAVDAEGSSPIDAALASGYKELAAKLALWSSIELRARRLASLLR